MNGAKKLKYYFNKYIVFKFEIAHSFLGDQLYGMERVIDIMGGIFMDLWIVRMDGNRKKEECCHLFG